MYLYQETSRYFAQAAGGLEELGAQELSALGAKKIKPYFRGVFFEADKAAFYRINYCSRVLIRVLAPLASFPCHSTKYLYNKAKEIRWSDFLSTEKTFAIACNVSNSAVRHSQYAALCLKDAIVDYFREQHGKRPDVNTTEPDAWFNLHIENNRATISVDASGGSLHRRGYRKEAGEAPMQETLAAAIIVLSGWNGEKLLCDPMCGSGTLLSEALMHYCRIPGGYLRKNFGFIHLPDFDRALWLSEKKKTDEQIRELPDGLISGSDIDRKAVFMASKNLQTLPSGKKVRLRAVDFRNIENMENTVIISNPPYGIRMGNPAEAQGLYRDIGDFLKQKCRGSEAYFFCGNRELIKKIELKPAWKKPLQSGGLDGRLVKYEIYKEDISKAKAVK
jgi:putative N6-adenine-specific DNA methylase